MNTAQKGAELEREIKQIFEAHGYSVIRGAGSKGEMLEEKIDLVATKLSRQGTERRVFIVGLQCKVNQR